MRNQPDRIGTLGRVLFGVGIVAFGVLQFMYGDFIPGRAPAWPTDLPGRLIWAYGSGAILILAGAAIVFDKKVRPAAMFVGLMVLVWALFRHVPKVAANPHGAVLTLAGKAVALFGGAFAVAGSASRGAGRTDPFFLLLGRCCLGAFLILGGVQHFQFTSFVATLIPAWIPGHIFWTYFAGCALIAGGIGLILPQTVRLAAPLVGMMLLTWVVVLHTPRAMAATGAQVRNEWTAVFEALTMSGIALVIAGSVRGRKRASLD